MPFGKLFANPQRVVALLGFLTLFLFACGWFAVVNCLLLRADAPRPDAIPTQVLTYLSGVHGLLVANLGVMLGVKVVEMRGGGQPRPIPSLQIVSGVLYFLAVLIALLLWWKLGFAEDGAIVVAVVPETVRTGTGVLLGALATGLGLRLTS